MINNNKKGVYMDFHKNKAFRLLDMYERLNKGELLKKYDLSIQYKVSEKTVARDISELRNYYAESNKIEQYVINYNKKLNGYLLDKIAEENLSNKDILALSKIILGSRAFNQNEMEKMINKLLLNITENDRFKVKEVILNEKYNYVPLKHGRELLDYIWILSQSITEQRVVEFNYKRQDGKETVKRIKAAAIMFSEFYFYVIGYLADSSKNSEITFRIDRIKNLSMTSEVFEVEYKNKFKDGELRKLVQFMYTGEKRKIKFEFTGPSIEAVLDKLPTAKSKKIEGKSNAYLVTAEVCGEGIDMWIRSQGEYIKML